MRDDRIVGYVDYTFKVAGMYFYSIVEDIRLYDITSCCFNQ